MANQDYIPVAADDWYQRRRQDAEGEFFRKVAEQGPRKGAGGSTRQGIYCFTADGTLLAYKNAGQDADVMREVFQDGLKKWNRLPAERRKPGAVKVGDPGRIDANYGRKLPEDGLILTAYTRILDRDKSGAWCKGNCDVIGGDKAARDHVWLTADEAKSLLPGKSESGERYLLPPKIVERIARFHLLDNTRGEPPPWEKTDIRSHDVALIVESSTPDRLRLRLEGAVLLADDANADKSKRGFDVKLNGRLEYDHKAAKWTRFDIAAAGDNWGEGTFTRNARPGRQPLGVAFELAGDSPADKVPPQFAREWGAYFGKY